jgi:hypothetical protein
VFVDYPSGVVTVSDMQGGLFIFDVSAAEAQQCVPASAPIEAVIADPKPRYLSVAPTNPGTQTALRVLITGMPPAFASHVGTNYWAQPPTQLPDPKFPGGAYWRSRLGCDPVYLDWASYGEIQISGEEILPGGTYDVQAVGINCNTMAEASYSAALPMETAPVWGDVVSVDGSGPPDGSINVLDIAAIVDCIKALPGSLEAPQADVGPGPTDLQVNVIDISFVVDGVRGFAYPFAGPGGCR